MARVSLIWLEDPALAGLEPAQVAAAAGVELEGRGLVEAAVVTAPAAAAPPELASRLAGKPVQWLDLGGEVGGGPDEVRLARAAAAVARAAGRAARATLPQLYTAKPAQTVLVAGAGLAAVCAAREAALLGHPVTLATPLAGAAEAGADDDPERVSLAAAMLPAQVEVLPRTGLAFLSGGGGDFTAELAGPEGAATRRFGAVVLSPPGSWQPGPEPGLDPELVRPLEDLAAGLEPGAGGWARAAVLAGVEAPASAAAFGRALEAALAVQARGDAQAYLFFREARVAFPGGERLYRRAREAGVLCVRVAPGGLAVSADGRELSWTDPVLGEELTLAPDAAAVAAEAGAELPAALDNPVRWPAASELAPESPRLDGGKTAISGLYLTGAAAGAPPADRPDQAAAAAADLAELLAGAVAPALPGVRHNLCASCLTCVRVCPHGVPRYGAEAIECAPAACLACGVCAAECPAEAIAPPGWSTPELTGALAAGLARAAEPRTVVFACSRSAVRAFARLSRQGHQWPPGLLLLPVNCAGRVGSQLILKALSLGAGGILVAGCHEGNCRSVSGNRRAKLRAQEARRLLAELELGPERVQFVNLASNQPRRLARAVEELLAAVERDGRPGRAEPRSAGGTA
jgi:coenzyme F420-reducing hydrogenase delta subunit/Pyruvate/2-oxoacid:ferredoxin oxidoreductase delta subunit